MLLLPSAFLNNYLFFFCNLFGFEVESLYVALTGFELRDLLATASQELRLKALSKILFFFRFIFISVGTICVCSFGGVKTEPPGVGARNPTLALCKSSQCSS